MFFISFQKLFLFLKYLNFCPDLFGHAENSLTKKLRLISKFMTSSTGKQIITIHILLNITYVTQNTYITNTQFGQSIEYKVRNIFLQKSCRK